MRRFQATTSQSAFGQGSKTIGGMSKGGYEGVGHNRRPRRGLYVKLFAVLVVGILGGAALRATLTPSHRVYGLMIDAGSTGSRMHTFVFSQDAEKKLTLVREDFLPVKPGLSSYKDNIDGAAGSLKPLLDRAKAIVPSSAWADTPVFLRATAGLRMTGEETANAILGSVRASLKQSGFRFDDASWATILGGSDEGIYSWITVNSLLDSPEDETVGTLEMGGGSAQIAFIPKPMQKESGNCSVATEVARYKDVERSLYTFSNLKFGLKMGRSMALTQFKSTGQLANNPCINSGEEVAVEVPFDENGMSIKLTGAGNFAGCRKLVDELVMRPASSKCECTACTYHSMSAPKPISEYVALAFYLERTVAIGMTTPMTVGDIRSMGEKVCKMSVTDAKKAFPSVPNGEATDLCLDLAFIAGHLEYGHGITEASGTKLNVMDKIKGVELGWSLGAMYTEMSRLGIGK